MHGSAPTWEIDGEDNEAGTKNIMCCLGENQGGLSHVDSTEYFVPKSFNRDSGYTGQSFHDAVKFCEGIDGYDICPYEAICPEGPGSIPLGGSRPAGTYTPDEADNGAWVPILNNINEWVQLGLMNSCLAYSHMHPDKPDWGMTGQDNEEITREVMCCLEQSDGFNFERAVMYETAIAKFHPHLFDREVYQGQTFTEAIDFCEEIDGYELCPYDAICPLGPNEEPVTAYQAGPTTGEHAGQGTWVPIIDAGNEWVQMAEENACVQYSHLHQEAPNWGDPPNLSDSGEDNEDLTRFVVCCAKQGMFDPNAVLEPVVHPSTGGVGTPVEKPPSTAYTHTEDEKMTYNDAAVKYTPKWYNREKGWLGSTYLDALQFCNMEDDKYELCPLAAICPLGQDTEPLGGYREEPNGSWVPVVDQGNMWVQVSQQHGACHTFDQENADPKPQWGITGEDDEDLTRHVACCVIQDGGAVTTITSSKTQEQIVADHLAAIHAAEAEQAAKEAAEAEAAEAKHNEITKEEALKEEFENMKAEEQKALAWAMDKAKHQNEMLADAQAISDKNENDIYVDMAQKYIPIWYDSESGWTGRTYLEAFQFCGSMKDGYGLCPLEAVCPMGVYSEPLGGFRKVGASEGGVGSYVPIIDFPNEWVQVSQDGGIVDPNGGGNADGWPQEGAPCLPWKENHEEAPEWGVTGEGDEALTKHVVCCLETTDTETTPETPDVSTEEVAAAAAEEAPVEAPTPSADTTGSVEQISLVYKSVSEIYQPKWFDRSKGWTGTTHTEAFEFCSDFNFNMPCPYEALCPLGKGSKPLGGYKDDANGAWAPIQDAPNAWVQLGEDNSCVKYSHLHPGPPAWGEEGGNEEQTRNIACCTQAAPDPTESPTDKPTFEPTPQPSTASPTPSPSTAPPTKNPVTPPPTYTDDHYYEEIAVNLEPLWFGRESGWGGSTYLEGLNFCAMQDSRVPCPYIAYCPLGKKGQPLGDVRDGVSWAPIMDAPNGWVQV